VTTSTASGEVVRSGKIAYRLGNQIWVANEDGSSAKAVFNSPNGSYALSPDGKTLVVQTTSTYVLVNVSDGVQMPLVGPLDLPVFSPDSSWLAYTAKNSSGQYTIRRVNRDGTADALLFTGGAEPQIAPDGTRIAFAKSFDPLQSDPLQVYDTSSKVLRKVPGADGAQQFAWAAGGILYFTKDAQGTVPGWLGATDKALSKSSTVASIPITDPPVTPGALFPSPDGTKVFFALTGDDGYSRLRIGDSSAKKIVALNTRYDAYPRGWLLDGSAVLYIDGNSIQNEATSLYRMAPDGTGREKVVSGAGL
jgi:Tol biopolymer transport system component